MSAGGCRWFAIFVCSTVYLLFAEVAFAKRQGIYPSLGFSATTGCMGCHSGGTVAPNNQVPQVTLRVRDSSNLDLLGKGVAVQLSLDIKRQTNDTRANAGFNVSTSSGTLGAIAASGVKLVESQVTHTGPKGLTSTDTISFDFTFTPTACGKSTLTGWGNLVNLADFQAGDNAASTVRDVYACGVGATCSTGSDCNSGLTCWNNKCCDKCGPGAACQPGSSTCGATLTCVDNVCCRTTACTSTNPCSVSHCGADGQCLGQPLPDGPTPGCGDTNICTNDFCQAGACVHPTLTCAPAEAPPCRTGAGSCSVAEGGCTYPLAPTGTPCNQDADFDYTCDASGNCSVQTPRPKPAYVWGQDSDALGNGSAPGSTTPVPFSFAPGLNLASMETGGSFVVAQARDGTVWSWGFNGNGQLGDGTTTSRSSPVQVTAISVFSTAVAAGANHALSLLSDGTVVAWGANGKGQLGVASGSARLVPDYVPIDGVIAISAGTEHSVALRADGSIWVWGSNALGQLGTGDQAAYTGPRKINTTQRFKAIAAGSNHTLALSTDGRVYGWGDNSNNQVKSGSTAPVLGITNLGTTWVRAIAAGANTSFSINDRGQVRAWGKNDWGQLGHGVVTPTGGANAFIPNFDGVISVSSKWLHTVAIRADGTVWTWGANLGGFTLGDPIRVGKDPTPRPVTGQSDALVAIASTTHTMVLRAPNNVATWGSNYQGLLGDGTTVPSTREPRRLTKPAGLSPSLNSIKQISASNCSAYPHNVLLSGDGKVWAWGSNLYGQLGVATSTLDYSNVPRYVSLPTPAIAVVAGCNVSAAVTADGGVWTWGQGTQGALGTGSLTNRPTPEKINATTAGIALASRGGHVLLLNVNGEVRTWGRNDMLQLGRTGANSPTFPTAAVALPDSHRARTIAAGRGNSFAILADGTVAAWGGQSLGTGATGSQAVPARVVFAGHVLQPLTDVTSISSSGMTVLATSRGMVFGWGDNTIGQLGTTLFGTYLTNPENVLPYPWLKSVATANLSSFALVVNGALVSTGSGDEGALGDGTDNLSTVWTNVLDVGGVAQLEGGFNFGMAIVP